MIKLFGIAMIGLFLTFCLNFSQTIAEPYEVGVWQGFRSAAISYTFDDNCPNQLFLAIPMFNEFGFTATLFTVTGWMPDWPGLQDAAVHGHEIASHTATHASLGILSDALQTDELKNSMDAINAHINGQKNLTLSYPNCITGKPSIVGKFYIAARGCQGYIESRTPQDLYNISSIICGRQGSVRTAADFISNDNEAASFKGWCVYLIHGIDDDGGYSPLPSPVLKAGLEYLNNNKDKFWVTGFGNAVRYIIERNSVTLTEISSKSDSILINITNNLDNSVYSCPITIRRPLPSGWSSCNVKQNGNDTASQIIEIDSVKYIMFDAVPGNGNILIIKAPAAGL